MGARGVFSVDSVTAPVYALQYEYPYFEAIALITLYKQFSHSLSPVETPLETYTETLEKEKRTESTLYMIALEVLKKVEETE